VDPVVIRPNALARLLLVDSLAPVAPVPDPLRPAPEFVQGQKYQATVEARLPNGNFKVLIAEPPLLTNLPGSAQPGDRLEHQAAAQTRPLSGNLKALIAERPLQMNLPENTQPGDKLELVLIAREPRLKFVLLRDAPANTGAGAASISTTGRFLGALVRDAGKFPVAPPLTSPAPLLVAPPADSRLLPGLLQQTLSRSGLFYESHQAQWIAGKNTLEELQQEPQGRLTAAAPPPPGPEPKTALPQLSLDAEPAATTAAGDARQNSEAPVHAQTLTLVQQQLAVLETGQLNWRGEIWPGQWLEWDIAEHPPAEHETVEPSRWQTRLRLTLPKLGEIAATLSFDSRGVRIALGAAATGTAALLAGSQQPLAAAMAAAGLSVLAVEVRHDAGQ
jgi:hypothetical protein